MSVKGKGYRFVSDNCMDDGAKAAYFPIRSVLLLQS